MIDNTARNAEIRRLYKSGLYYTQIAAQMGLSKSTVSGVCDRCGFRRGGEPREMKKRVCRKRAHNAKPHMPTMADRLAALDTVNMTVPQMCSALGGASAHYVRETCRRLGLSYKRSPAGWAAMHASGSQNCGGNTRAKRIAALKLLPSRTVFGLKAVPQDPSPRGCRYIHGDAGDADHHYCGAKREPGRPYCPAHDAACHVQNSSVAVSRIGRVVSFMAAR
jgi:hypothetical protein